MIVTREQVRQAVTARVESLRASFADYIVEVEYDNQNTINRSTQTLPFLAITFVYSDGYQTSLGSNSLHRPLGTVVVEAFDKEGAGTARINTMLDHFYRGLHLTDTMPPVRTYAARFSSKLPVQGWAAQAALIPFWYDTE
jgi:hypothetical protein